MALNKYFSNFTYVPEQNLLEDLGTEAVGIYGVDVTYIQREHAGTDKLFYEDPLSYFDKPTVLEMYIKNYSGYGGIQSDMMSKFGLTMADNLVLSVMRERFFATILNLQRPREGDLIWLPMANALFEIKYVEHEDTFYQHGTLQYFDLKCERFTYSNEKLQTGISAIDSINKQYGVDAVQSDLTLQNGTILTTVSGSSIQLESYTEIIEPGITLINGLPFTLLNGQQLSEEPLGPNVLSTAQNNLFDVQSQVIIDFTETNPFGKL